MHGSFKKTHPNGVHPQVAAKFLKVDLRTIFRFFERKTLMTIGETNLAYRNSLLDCFRKKYPQYSKEERLEQLEQLLKPFEEKETRRKKMAEAQKLKLQRLEQLEKMKRVEYWAKRKIEALARRKKREKNRKRTKH